MTKRLRLIVTAAVALLASVTLASPPAAEAATTVLIMGGTGEPDPSALPLYLAHVEQYYLAPFGPCPSAGSCDYQSLFTPEEFWPIPGWGGTSAITFDQSTYEGVADLESALTALPPDQTVVVFGYSQSGRISTLTMRDLQAGKVTLPPGTQLSFVLVGSTSRPNGGLWERLAGLHVPILDVTFDGATPTSPYKVTDIAFQYDGAADAPMYPIDLLSDVNALLGFYYLHGTYPGIDPADSSPPPGGLPDGLTVAQLQGAEQNPENIETFGDTTYVTIPTATLPIVRPLLDLASVTGTSLLIVPLVDLIQPTLRTLIEVGYGRGIGYGVPTTFQLVPPVNPVTLTADLVSDVGEGVSDALGNLGNTTPVPLPPLTAAESPDFAPTATAPTATAPTVTAHAVTKPTVTAHTVTKPTVTAYTVTNPTVTPPTTTPPALLRTSPPTSGPKLAGASSADSPRMRTDFSPKAGDVKPPQHHHH